MKKNELGRIGVLAGGWSRERSISLDSGHAVHSALRAMKRDSVLLDPAERDAPIKTLQKHDFDCAFIVMHGAIGEDGCIQGFLESINKPYTGSGVLGSALAMNKALSKSIWSGAGMPTPPWRLLWPGFDVDNLVEALGLPVVIKPVNQGSSIGVSLVTGKDEVEDAWHAAANGGGQPALAEFYIDGEEYSVAFVNDLIFSPVRVVVSPDRPFYDYDAKYKDNQTGYCCHGDLSLVEASELQSLAYRAAEALGVKGWGRVDLRRDRRGQFWLLEVNTVPGMTEHSLVPKAAANDGMDFNRLVLEILRTAKPELPR